MALMNPNHPSLCQDGYENIYCMVAGTKVRPPRPKSPLKRLHQQLTHPPHLDPLRSPLPTRQIFHLLPPCDAYRMSLTSLPSASYQPRGEDGALIPVLEGDASEEGLRQRQRVVWCPIDPRPSGAILMKFRGVLDVFLCLHIQQHFFPKFFHAPVTPTHTTDLAAAHRRHPLFFDPSLPPPLVAEIGPGDVLYLPSLW
jgi:hypothetical protein